jgi:hypothetical protein
VTVRVTGGCVCRTRLTAGLTRVTADTALAAHRGHCIAGGIGGLSWVVPGCRTVGNSEAYASTRHFAHDVRVRGTHKAVCSAILVESTGCSLDTADDDGDDACMASNGTTNM